MALAASLACGARGTVAKERRDCTGGSISHADDAKRFEGCERIRGDVYLGGALNTAVSFEGLTVIEGDLVIGPSYQLDNLSALGDMVRIAGDLRVEGNWRLRGAFFGKLQSVGGRIRVIHNIGLVALVLPNLHTFGALEVSANRNLERIDLSRLEAAGPMGTVSGPSLREVLAPERVEWRQKPAAEIGAKGS
ncbi:MAG: hypothetical protein GY811_27990 [Myxococcales bacterium]|nr:hypothetical protein [Myxococcales bacterium]